MQDIKEKYIIEAEPKNIKKGCWDVNDINIYQVDGDVKTKIGGYRRNYHSVMGTFIPFKQLKGGVLKEYALFSDNYTRTSVMELPSCKVIAQEPADSMGFCPVEYHVPFDDPDEDGETSESGLNGQFGFISGCVWGDDCSWKLQCLDLSEIDKGILKRDDRFGYVELPNGLKLKDAIYDEDYWIGTMDWTDFNKRLREEGNEGKVTKEDKEAINEPYIEIALPIKFNATTGDIVQAYSVISLLREKGYKIKSPTKWENDDDDDE